MAFLSSFFNNLFDRLAERHGKTIQDTGHYQTYRDYDKKGTGYSVECEIGEALADLMLMFSTMPIAGDSQRAKWLDEMSDTFFRDKAKSLISLGFIEGDSLVVPSWNGRNMQNIVVGSDEFVVLGSSADEITSCAYILDTTTVNNMKYQLVQVIELVPYKANDGSESMANRYSTYVARNGSIVSEKIGELFPAWKGTHETDWYIPNVDKLLIGRYRSFTIDPMNPNAVKGVPICFGAGEAIHELHYLLEQMHNEFGMSEKAIMADKRYFKKEWHGDDSYTVLPRGKERLFMSINGFSQNGEIHDWSPEIRYEAYLADIDKQQKLVESRVGVSHGIISDTNGVNYQNVDNVRKSQQKTMGFISTARSQAEKCLLDLVYAWNTIANYYNLTPMGEYDVNFNWSNEYIETFADRQNAILAGISVGAADQVDYRMAVFEESPETARERVEEIRAQQALEQPYVEEVIYE